MVQTIKANRLTPAQLDELCLLSTCVTASAIETFGVRLHNKGVRGFQNSLPIQAESPGGWLRGYGAYPQREPANGKARLFLL
jgi:hypothetical protein